MNRFLAGACLLIGWAAGVQAADAAPENPVVKNIKVLPDKAPDCTTLSNIVATVTRGCKSNDDKMIAIDNFMRISHYHRAYPPGGPSLLWFNDYGWSLCGGLAGLQMSLYAQIPGWSWRPVSWPGHNMSEAKYDGAWHWVDCFQKYYTWRPDPNAPNGRTIASQDDIRANPGLYDVDQVYLEQEKATYFTNNTKDMIVDGHRNWMAPVLLTCGDGGESKAVKSRHLGGEENTMHDDWKPAAYTAELALRPGFVMENTWDQLAPPEESWPLFGDGQKVGHTCGNKDFRNDPSCGPVLEPYYERARSYSNGRLSFVADFSSDAILKSFSAVENARVEGGALVPVKADAPASVTVTFESPYRMVKITGTADGAENFENAVKDASGRAKGQLKADVKIGFKTALKSLRLDTIVMNNAGALPYLSPGKNKVAVTVADPQALGGNKLVVTYAFANGFRDKSYEDLVKEGRRLAVQAYATWATNAPVVVQKIYTAKDLPATFDIDCPTPKDKFPVYPRMLFLRREILTPTGKPLPLPENATAPKMGKDDELKTLPNPFLIGSNPPPAAR